MWRRIVPPAFLSALLLITGPGSVRSGGGGAPPPPQPTGGLATRGDGPTPGEQTCIDELHALGRSPEATTLWIGQLAQSARSRGAVAELIRWLEFSPDWFRLSSLNSETTPPYCPAQNALMMIGPVAAPQLVDEYVYFFENTTLADRTRDGRWAALSGDPKSGCKPYDVQNPCYRLSSIALILSCDRRMARKAVEYTRQRMAGEPGNVRVQRACQDLIERIKAQFPEREWPQLFPTAPTMQ